MVDWTASMEQSFEYYIVDPGTWKDSKRITNVKSSTINRDSQVELKDSAIIDVTESVGECYIRVYLVTVQNGVTEKHPLGTYLVQTPTSNFDGKIRNVSMDAYSPLLELRERQPAIGYFIPKETEVMEMAYRLVRENARAPVVKAISSTKLHYDFVANSADTWLSFLCDLISAAYKSENGVDTSANYEFGLDEMGRIIFLPKQDIKSLQPVWTYNDDNSSILYPEIDMDHDLYGIPNVVEVIYSNGVDHYYARVENNDENSPVSIQNRGREIVHRVTDPELVGNPSEAQIKEYAEQLLSALSSPEYTITYKHGYCPVRPGDCIRLNYTRAGLKNVKAKVISQSIKCDTGCEVTETAVFTTKLWR